MWGDISQCSTQTQLLFRISSSEIEQTILIQAKSVLGLSQLLGKHWARLVKM
jgi:hypothetical protein